MKPTYKLILLVMVCFVYIQPIFTYVQGFPQQRDLVIDGIQTCIISKANGTIYNVIGNIIVKDNATLIVENTILNLEQSYNSQFNIFIRDKGKVFLTNSVINGSGYDFEINIYGYARLMNNTVNGKINCLNNSTIIISYSTIQSLEIFASNIKASYQLEPYHLTYWNTHLNTSTSVISGGSSPNITLMHTLVRHWSMEIQGYSIIEIQRSSLESLTVQDSSEAEVFDSTISSLTCIDSTLLLAYESTILNIECSNAAILKLVSCNLDNTFYKIEDSSEVYECWYLRVNVVNGTIGEGNSIYDATVSVSYHNGTQVAESKSNFHGQVNFALHWEVYYRTNGWVESSQISGWQVSNYTVTAKHGHYIEQMIVEMDKRDQRIWIVMIFDSSDMENINFLFRDRFFLFIIIPSIVIFTFTLIYGLYKRTSKNPRPAIKGV